MSRGFKVTIGLFIIIALGVLITPVFEGSYDGHGYSRIKTLAILNNVAVASKSFYDEYERWPTTTADFTNNERHILFLEWLPSKEWQDGWDHPLLYIPYNKEHRYGAVISLGEDGKEGGKEMSEDLEVRFTTKEDKKR